MPRIEDQYRSEEVEAGRQADLAKMVRVIIILLFILVCVFVCWMLFQVAVNSHPALIYMV